VTASEKKNNVLSVTVSNSATQLPKYVEPVIMMTTNFKDDNVMNNIMLLMICVTVN